MPTTSPIHTRPDSHMLELAASVFHHTRDGVMITALDGSIMMVNKAFTAITGYSKDEVLGKNPKILKSGRQSPEFYTAMWDAIQVHGFWQGEAWNRRKDGSYFAENIAITMVRDELGAPSHYIGVFSDITTASEKRRWLEQQSYFDTLTGLPNRILMMKHLKSAVEESKFSGLTGAVAFIDLDGFKQVNDKFGHARGDSVLIQAAERLVRALRKSDTLARFGGDEFIAVLPELKDGLVLSGLMTRLLEACKITVALEGTEVSISGSIGVAFFPSDATSAEDLLTAADAAMYVAKREGRNRYRAHRPGNPAMRGFFS